VRKCEILISGCSSGERHGGVVSAGENAAALSAAGERNIGETAALVRWPAWRGAHGGYQWRVEIHHQLSAGYWRGNVAIEEAKKYRLIVSG
jgi:hypothetical protein